MAQIWRPSINQATMLQNKFELRFRPSPVSMIVIVIVLFAVSQIRSVLPSSIDMAQLRRNPLGFFDYDTSSRFNFMVLNDGQVTITPELEAMAEDLQISFYNVANFIKLQEDTEYSFQFDYSNHSMTMVIVNTENRTSLEYMTRKIDDFYYYDTSPMAYFNWTQPKRINNQLYFLLIWPTPLETESGVAKAMKSVANVNFTLGTNVYVLFPKVNVSSSAPTGYLYQNGSVEEMMGRPHDTHEHDEMSPTTPTVETGASSTQWQIWGSYSIKDICITNLIWSAESQRATGIGSHIIGTNFGGPSKERISMLPLHMSSKVHRRQNFHQVPITAIAVGGEEGYPYEVSFARTNNESNEEPQLESGFGVSLYRDLKLALNFSERARKTGGWMQRDSEIHLKLENEKVDICITQNVYIPETYEISTVLQPTFPLKIMAFCKDPLYTIQSTIFVNIFPRTEWIVISLILGALVISISICTWIRNVYLEDYSKEVKAIEDEVFLWGLAYFCQRSWHISPSSWSLKLIFFSGGIFSLIIYSAYLGLLVSKLSVHNPMLTSFQDLLQHNYTLVINEKSISMMYFVKGVIRFYHTPKAIALNATDIEVAVMEKHTMVLYYWDSIPTVFPTYSLENLDQFICSSIAAFPVDHGFVQSGFVIKRGSPFKDIFNNKIIRIKELGLNKRYLNHYTINTQPTCFLKNRIHHLDLGLDETEMVFQVWALSMIFSLCLLLVETLGFRLWNTQMLT